MSYEYSGYDITLEGADLGRDLVRGAMLSESTTGTLADITSKTSAGPIVCLLTDALDDATTPVAVRVSGIASMRAAAAVAAADVLTLDSTDRVAPTTSAGDVIHGVALAAGGIGDLVPVLMHSGFGLYPS